MDGNREATDTISVGDRVIVWNVEPTFRSGLPPTIEGVCGTILGVNAVRTVRQHASSLSGLWMGLYADSHYTHTTPISDVRRGAAAEISRPWWQDTKGVSQRTRSALKSEMALVLPWGLICDAFPEIVYDSPKVSVLLNRHRKTVEGVLKASVVYHDIALVTALGDVRDMLHHTGRRSFVIEKVTSINDCVG